MPRMTGARFMVETMKEYGVSHVFYMPMIVTRALVEMEKVGIRRIMTHSEKAAAYRADGYARAARRPAVCMSQNVGAANLAAGLQDAYLGCSPVVALTGRRPPGWRDRHSYQEIDHWQLFEPVTKYNVQVETLEELSGALRQAFRSAVSGAPAPTHVELPGIAGDVLANAEGDLEVIREQRFAAIPPFRPRPDPSDIEAVARLLAAAERPALVAGGGATYSGAGAEVLALIEKLQVPMAFSLNAKGLVPDNHPLNVGLVGAYSRWSANRVIAEADMVLFVGSRAGSHVTNNWLVPRPGTKVAQIDVDAEELGRNYPNSASVLGDARESLRQLLDAVDAVPARDAWLGRVNELVAGWTAEFEGFWQSDAVPMRPERVCHEVSDALPDDAVVVVDTGHNAMWSGMYMDINKPGQRYIRCAGSLGWAFPAAIGAKCAVGDRPVICFTGDGGFWYHLTELETAVHQGIPLITVVNDNRSLNQTRRSVERAYEGSAGDPDLIWQFTDMDFAALAQEMGATGILVTRPGELKGAIEMALEADGPVVIDAKTDPDAIAPPPWG